MTDDIEITDLRRKPAAPTPPPDPRGDLDALREAMQFAWRPAGSRSLGERWLRAGEEEQSNPMRPLEPPRPPALPKGLGRRARRLKR
jgi:hypothetical protein